MASIDLQFRVDEPAVQLTLGLDINAVASRLAPRALDLVDDSPDPDRTYARVREEGVDLIFKNDVLTTVFIFLVHLGLRDPGQPFRKTSTFTGSTNFLDRAFLAAPSPERFQSLLEQQWFTLPARKYPMSVV